MPYIHQNTFDIIQSSNIDGDLDVYFEVDEPIALPIQELNRKGYITKFCCCGHSFGDKGEAFASPEMPSCDNIIVGTCATEDMPNGSHRILYRNTPYHQSYIMFADETVLPTAPAGWYYEASCLNRDYPDNLDEYSFMEAMLRSMKDLYMWVLRLPQAGDIQISQTQNAEFIFLIKDYLVERGLKYESSIDKAIHERESGKVYNLSDHIRGLVYSLLTNQTSWKRIVPHLEEVDDIFYQYDIERIKAYPGSHFSDALFSIKCGNRKTSAQMQALHDNIAVFERIITEYGSIDTFVTSAPAHEIITTLSASNSKYKLHQVGEALAWEYIRNVGIDGAKPDLHLRRFFGINRLSVSTHDSASVAEVINAVSALSKATGLSMAAIDNLIWSYCAHGYGEVCTATPYCAKCVIREYCKHD